MEDTQFDTLAKVLGALANRRLMLGALLGSALGFHGMAEAAKKGKKNNISGGRKGDAKDDHKGGDTGDGTSDKDNDKKRGGRNKRQDNERHAESNAVAADAKKKKCPPCKKRTKGRCKGSLPDGTACTGGTCRAGTCLQVASGCTTADSCPAPPAAQRCAEATCFAGTCGFGPKAENTLCRPAAGECDVAEVCNGISLNCPADQFKPSGTECSGGSCQNGSCVANCTTADTCPTPPASQPCAVATCIAGKCGFGPKPANSVCRAAIGECDLAAVCNGSSLTCPANPFRPANTPCSDDGNICTRDICSGSSANCTHPPQPPGTPCTSDAQPICTQDICNGSGACTHPAVTNGTNCGQRQQCCAGTCCGVDEGCKFGTTCCLGGGRGCSSTVPCCGSCVGLVCI